MIRVQHRISIVLMVAILCPAFWVYGGAKKRGGVLGGSPPPAARLVETGQAVVNQQSEMVALDADTGTPWVGEDRQQVQALLARLKQRRIAIQPTFYKMLGKANPAQRGKLVSRCRLFFDNVDTQEIINTSCLTSMIRTKTQVGCFLAHGDDFVRRVASTPALKSLTSLFNGRGFPTVEEDTQAFIEWQIWWQGGGLCAHFGSRAAAYCYLNVQ